MKLPFIFFMLLTMQCTSALPIGSKHSLNSSPPHQNQYEKLRSYFYHEAGYDGVLNDEQKGLFFSYPEMVFDRLENLSTVTGTEPDFLMRADRAVSTFKASDLWRNSQSTPVLTKYSDQKSSNVPIIIIFPGIMGEFVHHFPFDEIFSPSESQFAAEWQRLAQNNYDEVYSLKEMKKVPYPLSDLVLGASVDVEAKVVAKLLFLKPPLLSLETLGTVEENSSVYFQRLNKVFSLLPWQKSPIYFLGYSRGANVALEMASKLDSPPQEALWASQVKGVVSLVGSLWGSHLADDAFNTDKPTGMMVASLKNLADSLTPAEGSPREKAHTALANATEIATKLRELLSATHQTTPQEALKWENLNTLVLPEFGFVWDIATDALLDNFKMQKFITDYNGNVARFKIVINKIYEGTRSLTTAERLRWWKNNQLPAHLKYFSTSATMGDPTLSADSYWPLNDNPLAVNKNSIDYPFLRKSYYDLLDSSGVMLNDSQMTLSRTVFYPSFHRTLNPSQLPYETASLGVLGISHWSIALQQAIESSHGRNPFPRAALIRALSKFLSELD